MSTNQNDIARMLEMQRYMLELKQMDSKRHAAAAQFFEDRNSLSLVIQQEITPCVVLLKDAYGRQGTGFFQTPNWLVSNAHVVPNSKTIKDMHMSFISSNDDIRSMEIDASYHRHELDRVPDFALINTRNGYSRGLSLEYTQDAGYSARVSFYVFFNHETNKIDVKYIKPSKYGACPLIYECEDGIPPMHGCSGSPVIEARVIFGKQPKWQFKTIGVVYARCTLGEAKMLVAIPISQEFKQIFSILIQKVFATREEQLAQISFPQADIDRHAVKAMGYQNAASLGLQQFADGETELDIDLPDGLEKLLYDCIIDFESSYWIAIEKSKKVDIQTMSAAFEELIATISEAGEIPLMRGDNYFHNKLFRVDCTPGTGCFMLDLQDNTGKFKIGGQPASSVFAKVIVRANKDTKTYVNGKELAEGLRDSKKNLSPLLYSEKQNIIATATAITGTTNKKKKLSKFKR